MSWSCDGAARTLRRRRPRHGREHRIISALAATPVPVPPALALCDDESLNGSSFYVMGRVDGAVVDNPQAADDTSRGMRLGAAPESRSSTCWPPCMASTWTPSASATRHDGTASSPGS